MSIFAEVKPVCLDLVDLVDHVVRLVSQDKLDSQDFLDLTDNLEAMDGLDLRENLDHREMLVCNLYAAISY